MNPREEAMFQYLEMQRELFLAQKKKDFEETKPFNNNGMPTSQLAFYLISNFYKSRDRDVSLEKMAMNYTLPKDILGIMFRQFEELDLIIETSPGMFRYNLNNCKDPGFQAKVEKALLEFCHTIVQPYRHSYTPSDQVPYLPGDKKTF